MNLILPCSSLTSSKLSNTCFKLLAIAALILGFIATLYVAASSAVGTLVLNISKLVLFSSRALFTLSNKALGLLSKSMLTVLFKKIAEAVKELTSSFSLIKLDKLENDAIFALL